VYEDISYDIKDEINERVDGINGWSFSEYFIVNDMGLEHRANVKHADDLNEARWNVAKSKDSLDRIDVRLSKHMLNLASNAIILSSILLQNKSAFSAIKGFIGDGKENGGR
jgi:hypothetical protein